MLPRLSHQWPACTLNLFASGYSAWQTRNGPRNGPRKTRGNNSVRNRRHDRCWSVLCTASLNIIQYKSPNQAFSLAMSGTSWSDSSRTSKCFWVDGASYLQGMSILSVQSKKYQVHFTSISRLGRGLIRLGYYRICTIDNKHMYVY